PALPVSASLDPTATGRRYGQTYPSLHLPHFLRSPADSAARLLSNPQSPLSCPSDTYLQNTGSLPTAPTGLFLSLPVSLLRSQTPIPLRSLPTPRAACSRSASLSSAASTASLALSPYRPAAAPDPVRLPLQISGSCLLPASPLLSPLSPHLLSRSLPAISLPGSLLCSQLLLPSRCQTTLSSPPG